MICIRELYTWFVHRSREQVMSNHTAIDVRTYIHKLATVMEEVEESVHEPLDDLEMNIETSTVEEVQQDRWPLWTIIGVVLSFAGGFGGILYFLITHVCYET